LSESASFAPERKGEESGWGKKSPRKEIPAKQAGGDE